MTLVFACLKEENTQSFGTSECVQCVYYLRVSLGIPKGEQWVAFVKLLEVALLQFASYHFVCLTFLIITSSCCFFNFVFGSFVFIRVCGLGASV